MNSDDIQQHVEIPMGGPSAKIAAEEGADSGIVIKAKQNKKKNEMYTGEICFPCVVCCCNFFCCKCGNKDKNFKGYRCLAKFMACICKKICGKKAVFSETDKRITIKGVFEHCQVGDLIFISTLIPFDSTCKVSSFIASDIFLAHDCQSLIRDHKKIFGWDNVGIIVEGKEGSGGPLNILEISKAGFKVYDLFDRLQEHARLNHVLGVSHLVQGTFENSSHHDIFYEIIKDTKNMNLKVFI